jgi:hypothetical protein
MNLLRHRPTYSSDAASNKFVSTELNTWSLMNLIYFPFLKPKLI